MLQNSNHSYWLLVGLFCLVWSGGCGNTKDQGPMTKVTGSLSYKGKSLKAGDVVIKTSDGSRSITVGVDDDGRFVSEEAPVGKVKVSVTFPARPPEWDIPNAPKTPAPEDENIKKEKERIDSLRILPKSYFEVNDFVVEYELKEGEENKLTIDLP